MLCSEQPPPEAMMQLHKIADVEIGWLAIVYSMINKITTADPLGPAVITLILDECPLPSKVCLQMTIYEVVLCALVFVWVELHNYYYSNMSMFVPVMDAVPNVVSAAMSYFCVFVRECITVVHY